MVTAVHREAEKQEKTPKRKGSRVKGRRKIRDSEYRETFGSFAENRR